MVHSIGSEVSHFQLAQNLRAAVAAQIEELLVILLTLLAHFRNVHGAAEDIGAGKDIVPKHLPHFRIRRIAELRTGLYGAFIPAADNGAEAGGVAGATDVFEQKCVVELAHQRCGEIDSRTDAHAEQARAQCMSRCGALREIEWKCKG